MPLSQIHYVDVVTYSGPIRSIVVIPENLQTRPSSNGHLRNVWHQVVGFPVGILTDTAGLVRSDRIEVTQRYHRPSGIRLTEILQYFLGEIFAFAVGVGAIARRMFLVQWKFLRFAIYSGTRTINKFEYVALELLRR